MRRADLRDFAKTTTARLAASYLAIIMLMSIGFSFVFFNASSNELGRQIPPPSSFGFRRYDDFTGSGPNIHAFFQQRIDEGRHALLIKLILLDLLAFLLGAILSYYLARRTLQPIEDNMEAQAQFVSDASHELRTPLTAIQTTNEVALRRPSLASNEAKELLEYNVAEVIKLRSLTDSLLRLAKQETAIALVPTELAAVTSDALNTVLQSAVAKHISVDDSIPNIEVAADRPSLLQAITTVLDNAVKYSNDGSTITVAAETSGKYALLHITDTGRGIAADHMPHIFDRFYRVDESRNKQQHEGYGIGLALAKKIIHQHHGEIIATSTEGTGSTFTFKLPLS